LVISSVQLINWKGIFCCLWCRGVSGVYRRRVLAWRALAYIHASLWGGLGAKLGLPGNASSDCLVPMWW